MKKLIAPAMLVLLTLTAWNSNAQTASAKSRKEKNTLTSANKDRINYLSKDHFITDFGKVDDVKWTRGQQFDEAFFTKDGVATTAYYDYQSDLVGTTTKKTFESLPANAQKEIKSKYQGYNIGAVVMFDDDEENDMNMMLYGKEFQSKDNYFVELSKNNKQTIVQVNMDGEVFFFKQI